MLVERTEKEVIVRLPSTVSTEDLQEFLNFARYKGLISAFEVPQSKVDRLADDINAKWWAKNKSKLTK